MSQAKTAKFTIGDVVRHRFYPFRGVIYDVLAENAHVTYEAYVSEQNLLPDDSGEPCRHPLVEEYFDSRPGGRYQPRMHSTN
jgi:heat shock protein HspQ